MHGSETYTSKYNNGSRSAKRRLLLGGVELPNGIHHNICDELDGGLGGMDRVPVEVLGGVCARSSSSACLADLNHPGSTAPS
jgi:hypothetical protein